QADLPGEGERRENKNAQHGTVLRGSRSHHHWLQVRVLWLKWAVNGNENTRVVAVVVAVKKLPAHPA
ncbi:MAG: hypothetical protein IJ228_01825, partial [Succinivibrio sp.]|nr:hypothetical protein [Succinivibrio sp.]